MESQLVMKQKNDGSQNKVLYHASPRALRFCSVEEAIAYQNDDILHRFTKVWDVNFEEAEDLFLEIKKWLWLCSQPKEQGLGISTPLLILDEMWHNFILFTAEYTEYCYSHFGRYIHHAPTSQSEIDAYKEQREIEPAVAMGKMMEEQQKQFELIYKKLGVETLFKWYVEYPERYNADFFKESHRPMEMGWSPSPEMKKIVTLFRAGKVKILD